MGVVIVGANEGVIPGGWLVAGVDVGVAVVCVALGVMVGGDIWCLKREYQ